MEQENDLILSKVAVRLRDAYTASVIGSGIIYYSEHLKDAVYVLTAAHCLYEDGDSFKQPKEQILVDVYAPNSNTYIPIKHIINYDLVSPQAEKDVAVLILSREEVFKITGVLPAIAAVNERHSVNNFAVKGFPSATYGEELVCIFPKWAQAMTGTPKFQLHFLEDYKGWATNGFSGSGVFLHTNNQIYLFGIFTRYREENRGKVIYCQYIDTINELLESNFHPTITYTFWGEHGLTPSFFKIQIDTAVKNLGPRFSSKLNFRLPIAHRFHEIAKDSFFKKSLLKNLDEWLIASRHYHKSQVNIELTAVEAKYEAIRNEVRDTIPNITWSPAQKIELETIITNIQNLNSSIQKKREELYIKQREEQKKEGIIQRDYGYQAPYENQLKRLREVYDTNNQLISSMSDVNVDLANYPFLLIDGEAGSGKSHLLGDVATERNKCGLPTLLLLGQHFKSGQNVWQNILTQLGILCPPIDLLITLNNIGKQVGSRVLILIDALNEGAGKELWYEELAGFASEISRYPFIGLVLTVRSTYWDVVVPSNLQRDLHFSRITHEGFKGNEYAALNVFCEFYELQQPNFPIIAPEFTNPLFLQLICEGVKASESKVFPQGLQGFLAIFEFYLKAVSEKLARRREEYRRRTNLVEQSINEVARFCFQNSRTRVLPLEEAEELFDEKFDKYRYLLDDLILEGILIQNSYKDYRSSKEYEIIYFAYERFGDFIIAQQLLNEYTTTEEIITAFAKGNRLGKLIEEGYWDNKGILQAMSVILPEKYSLEIVEVYDWVFNEGEDKRPWHLDQWLSQFLLESLKWRTAQSVDNEKLTAWLNSGKCNVSNDEYFLFLLELTILPNHPFNSDRLHRLLKRTAMPERDSFWQLFLLYYHGNDENDYGYPIKRLIDWAWQPLISAKLDYETARLTGQTLAWVLASTIRSLRDKTTKAMVNLLEEQPDALIAILKAFSDVDDMYISERLLAVAYGCSLRTSSEGSLLKIAQYVYEEIFSHGNPPNHILLRDYARNIVEYALYKQLPILAEVALIRPPYRSRMPEVMPSDDDISKYKNDYSSEEYKKGYQSTVGQIYFSVIDWDFGRYIVDSALSNFVPVSFTAELNYKNFIKSLNARGRALVKSFATFYEWKNPENTKIKNGALTLGEDKFEPLRAKFLDILSKTEDALKEQLSSEQSSHFYNVVVPHLDSLQRAKDEYRNSFNSLPIKRWIVERAFNLGFSAKLHGAFDSNHGSHDRFHTGIERIGKKYQWIAFYEIMAMISDNYKLGESWSSHTKTKYYQGPWELLLRNIDPAFTSTTNNKAKESGEDELGIVTPITTWWIDNQYNYWNQLESKWISNTEDLPNPIHIIERTDDDKQEWVYLNLNVSWKEPKPFGYDKYTVRRKEIWYMVQGYLVRKRNKTKVLEWLREQDFGGRWMPESSYETGLFNRENYWSPISLEYQKQKNVWETFGNSSYKVIIATSEAVGEMSEDKSDAHFRYDMPCQTIFEGMKLQYAPIDGEFKNGSGEVVVSSVNSRGVLIRKQDFVDFLKESDLDIVWVLLGEKRSLGGNDRSHNYSSTISGVYSIEDTKVVGLLKLIRDEI